MLTRYGVRSALQVPEFLEKQQRHALVLTKIKVGGKTFEVRGHEGCVIEFLHKEKGIPVKYIINAPSNGVPTIKYKDGKRTRCYFPDILLSRPGREVLIEVKSDYTLGVRTPKMLADNIKKFRAAAEAYEFWLVVCLRKKNFLLLKNPGRFTAEGLRKWFVAEQQALKTRLQAG